jgi:hypothetical protein
MRTEQRLPFNFDGMMVKRLRASPSSQDEAMLDPKSANLNDKQLSFPSGTLLVSHAGLQVAPLCSTPHYGTVAFGMEHVCEMKNLNMTDIQTIRHSIDKCFLQY